VIGLTYQNITVLSLTRRVRAVLADAHRSPQSISHPIRIPGDCLCFAPLICSLSFNDLRVCQIRF
jgi:hypothetical protein